MKTFFKIPILSILFIFIYFGSASAIPVPLPAADFGGAFSINLSDSTLNWDAVSVYGVWDKNGTYTINDEVIGARVGTDFSGWNFDFNTLALTIDPNAANDFNIGDYLTGMLSNYSVLSLGVGRYQLNALLSDITYNAQGSTFIQQFEEATLSSDIAQVISQEFIMGQPSATALLINTSGKVAPVPEPATMFLLGTGMAGLVAVARRRKVKKT